MKKSLKFILFIMLISSIFIINKVYAKEIILEDVLSYMQENNILEEEEYFYMFGKMLNGENEYQFDSFKYTIIREEANININVTLHDKEAGNINKTTVLRAEDGLIKYTNNHEVDSLESRIDTIIFNQLIYSIGGARGYEKEILINWMNQIDLNKVTATDGIEVSFENVKYDIKENGRTYEYEVSVPKSYTIDVNKVTNNIPPSNKVEIKNVEPGISSVTMNIYAENHRDEMCNVYRKNKANQYELVGTVSCNNGEFTDIKLKDEETYYYQATLADKVMCSPDTEVTTLKSPMTGAFLPIIGFIALIIIGAALYQANKEHRLFKKI